MFHDKKPLDDLVIHITERDAFRTMVFIWYKLTTLSIYRLPQRIQKGLILKGQY